MEVNSNRNTSLTSACVLMINSQGIMLSVQGNDYFLSYNRVPWLKNARICDVLNVSMCGRNAIAWETLGIDLEVESLKHPERYPLIMKNNPAENIPQNL